jgi:hypothetical protein
MKVSCLAVIIFLAMLSAESNLQTGDAAFKEIRDYSLDANNLLDALLQISAQFEFEWARTADTLKPVRFSRNRTTVRDTIQEVVSTTQPTIGRCKMVSSTSLDENWRTIEGIRLT